MSEGKDNEESVNSLPVQNLNTEKNLSMEIEAKTGN